MSRRLLPLLALWLLSLVATAQTTWTGATNTTWTTATNWTNGVPDANTDAIIAPAPNQPTLSGTQGVRALTIQAGAQLDSST